MPSSTIPPADVLRRFRVIAVVGASKNPGKDAFTVPLYLKQHGYTVIPVNPTAERMHGERAYASLAAIPEGLAERIDIVKVFRPSEELANVAVQVADMKKKVGRPLVFWAQLGLENESAKSILQAAGIDFVMDSCMMVEHQMLGKLSSRPYDSSRPRPTPP